MALFYRCIVPIVLLSSLHLFALDQRQGDSGSLLAPIPAEVSSEHFVVMVNGRRTPVVHAAGGYYLLNFETSGPADITVTASDARYWEAGVEIQPMRFGIRPQRNGASIKFTIPGSSKLSISRPGDHYGDSEMLFLFANEPDRSKVTAKTPGVRYYGPGVHRENIDAHSGDNIYLAAGAVVFGALNLWQVHDVHVSGLGMIIYDGPQDPIHDEGWMHKPNWHVIVMDNARNIDIEGITAIVRSRTWMVQMRDSRGVTFRNVKVLGNCPGNANQDGLDWLGGGDTLVQDSFFRASDDVFAMYGNWDGYSEEALTTPGHEVSNIVIERSTISTSISNVVRTGWPKKVFNSHHFVMRDSDVLHMGEGGCGIPFALFEIWADPGGKGLHSDYKFEDLRLEDWYSLTQLRQPDPGIKDISFTNIWSMDGPGMVASALQGQVSEVNFRAVDLGSGDAHSNSDLPLDLLNGAQQPVYQTNSVSAAYSYTPGNLKPGSEVVFRAAGGSQLRYVWLFGDGSTAEGQVVRHSFPDSDGTLLDGSGRFRVLLLASDHEGHQAWGSQSVVVSSKLQPASAAVDRGASREDVTPREGTDDRWLNIPQDGGYTFFLLSSTTASLDVGGVRAQSRKLRPQVCGSPGFAVQQIRVSASLARGLHGIHITRGPEPENAAGASAATGQPVLLWEGPGIPLSQVPAEVFHSPGR